MVHLCGASSARPAAIRTKVFSQCGPHWGRRSSADRTVYPESRRPVRMYHPASWSRPQERGTGSRTSAHKVGVDASRKQRAHDELDAALRSCRHLPPSLAANRARWQALQWRGWQQQVSRGFWTIWFRMTYGSPFLQESRPFTEVNGFLTKRMPEPLLLNSRLNFATARQLRHRSARPRARRTSAAPDRYCGGPRWNGNWSPGSGRDRDRLF